MFVRIALLALASAVFNDALAQQRPWRLTASAIPLVTRATPTAERQALTEAYFAQPMLNAGWLGTHAFAVTTLDFEGLTMRRGELTTGMYGEGYVDRRHPHTYLHELVAGVSGSLGPMAMSLTAGKGFVPFGSDDPMLRPTVKYPINHHLAQILERAVLIAGARYRSVIIETAAFNGDEPTDPGSSPTLDNFGDSWATRLSVVGGPRGGLRISGSYAFVRSPESANGQGLDQRKHHASVQWAGTRAMHRMAAMVEWARAAEQTPAGDPAFTFTSWLGEAEWTSPNRTWSAALRLERTDRPEEERAENPFRSVRPAIDHSLIGITRWNVVTVTAALALTLHRVGVMPFAEASLSRPRPTAPAAFQPESFYGSDRLWMVSVGARLSVGPRHEGMGYYGVRREPAMTSHHH
jgi:hypothetical protein